jgi:spore coat polysaccharide biosynthesis predicted glycosyltransferase SpsG
LKNIRWDLVTGIIFDIRTVEPLDNEILNKAKDNNIKTGQITDLGLSKLDVNIIINASINIDDNVCKGKKDSCFSGSQYVISHHKFIHFNNVKRKYKKKVRNLLVSLGGAVQYRQLRDLIDTLYRYNYRLKITGGFYLKKSARKILKRLYPKIKFVGTVESLARPLFEADIAVITAGTTSYEAAAVGTPAIYFFYNKEQEEIANTLEKENVGIKISSVNKFDKDKLLNVLDDFSLEKRTAMGKKAKKLIDGKGVYRIIELLSKTGIVQK